MRRRARRRLWLEAASASLSFILLVVTLLSHEWIEEVFGVDPDRHSGALEWSIVAVLFVTTALLSFIAGREYRRVLPAT